MATKSNNTQGNPWHDENGRFTSEGENGVNDDEVLAIKLKSGVDLSNLKQNIKLKSGVNLGNITKQLGGQDVDVNTPLTFPTSIQDAEMQGNRILGGNNVVGYLPDTDLAVAHEFNKALKDVVTDFPNLFSDNQLYLFGTKNERPVSEFSSANDKVIIDKVLSNPVYEKKLNDLNMNKDIVSQVILSQFSQMRNTFNNGIRGTSVGGLTSMSDFSRKNHLINTNNIILFNKTHSKSLENWNNYPKSSIRDGHFLPIGDKTGAYMVASHEIGHHVFEKLIDLMDDNDKAQLKSIMWKETGGKARPFELQKMKLISGYATTSRHEHMAEAFANVYCMGDNATSHNKNIVNFLKKVYNKIYGSK